MSDDLAGIERVAVDLAWGAGEILARYFGGNVSVEFKDEHGRDPVTNADTEVQDFLTRSISKAFPEHGILGEEGDEEGVAADSEAPDYLWILDPLDGTKNFLHGLPVFACSIGVLFRGEPVVGAVFTPWPNEQRGVVHHAHRGGGAYANDKPISVLDIDSPQSGQLATVPGSFDWLYRFAKPMRGKSGDPRVTGSIAYELVLVARGVTQYMYTSNPHLWDVAGGVAIAIEAGASQMIGRRRSGPMGLFPSLQWRESTTLVDNWTQGGNNLRRLRRWARPLLLGAPPVARTVSSNLSFRRNARLWLRFWWRRRRRRKD